MKKKLFILNTFYPFSRQEDFLANEMKFIIGFDEVIVFPNSISEPKPKQLYNCPESVSFVVNKLSYKKAIFRNILCCLFDKSFYSEICFLLKNKRFSFARLGRLISFMLYSENSYLTVKKYLQEKCLEDDVTIYSYWLHTSAFVACKIKTKFPNVKFAVSRCHRFDLYEYANEVNYIPQREFILSKIDEVHSISDDGLNYLTEKFPNYKEKIKVSRLGTFDKGISVKTHDNILRIVSCSWMRKVKRVHRIFESIKDTVYPIEWTHFGDGETFSEIKSLVESNNNTNLKVQLAGSTNNKEVIEAFLNNNYDVFVNVSENEGIPVSIMEAMSCGLIPVATDVGGTRELVINDFNGFLLPANFENSELQYIFAKIYCMSDDEKLSLRQSARDYWLAYFNAEKNYPLFFDHLSSL